MIFHIDSLVESRSIFFLCFLVILRHFLIICPWPTIFYNLHYLVNFKKINNQNLVFVTLIVFELIALITLSDILHFYKQFSILFINNSVNYYTSFYLVIHELGLFKLFCLMFESGVYYYKHILKFLHFWKKFKYSFLLLKINACS